MPLAWPAMAMERAHGVPIALVTLPYGDFQSIMGQAGNGGFMLFTLPFTPTFFYSAWRPASHLRFAEAKIGQSS